MLTVHPSQCGTHLHSNIKEGTKVLSNWLIAKVDGIVSTCGNECTLLFRGVDNVARIQSKMVLEWLKLDMIFTTKKEIVVQKMNTQIACLQCNYLSQLEVRIFNRNNLLAKIYSSSTDIHRHLELRP